MKNTKIKGYPRAELRKRIRRISEFIEFLQFIAFMAVALVIMTFIVTVCWYIRDKQITHNLYRNGDFDQSCYKKAFPDGTW